jgi:hypothetical protein
VSTQGFLQDQGLAVNDGLDAIAGGLQALLGGSDDDEEGEGEEGGGGGKKAPVFVTETYRRKRPQGSEDSGPAELELSLASSHHSLWGAFVRSVDRSIGGCYVHALPPSPVFSVWTFTRHWQAKELIGRPFHDPT